MAEKRSSAPRAFVMFLLLAVAAVLALRALGPGGSPAEEARGGKPPLSGTVRHADGTPVPGAVVEASFDLPGKNVPTNLRSPPTPPDGRFAFPDAPTPWKALRVRVSRGALGADMDLTDAPPPLDLSLTLPDTFKVGGLVLGQEDGRPLEGLAVRLGDLETRTDHLGRFEFPPRPAAALNQPLPELEIRGKGRKTLRRALPVSGGLDDLLLRVERE